MPRPAVYLRVSTEQQREKVSIRSQEDYLRRWLESQGYDPDDDILWYRDDGVSGEMPIASRGDGARLVADIKAGVVGAFVATFSVSRISREASDFFGFRRLLNEHKLILIGVSEGASTGDDGGDMAVSINALFADWSNKALRKASKAGLLRGAREGKWMSRPPMGYRVENRELIIYEPEATIIRDVFRWYTEENVGAAIISRRLTDLKILSPGGGDVWQTNMVLRILHNPVYKGETLYNRATTKNNRRQGYKQPSEYISIKTPAIVAESVYDRAQVILARSAKRFERTGRTQSLSLLNRVKCAICGRNYYRGAGNSKYGYYRHDAYKDADKKCTNSTILLARQIDEIVWQKVVAAIRDPHKWMHEIENDQQGNEGEWGEVERIEAAIKDTAEQLERLEDAYVVRGTMTGERYAVLARELRDKDERLRIQGYELRQRLGVAAKQSAARQSAAMQMLEFQEIAESASDEDKAYLMDVILEAVTVDNTSGEPQIKVKWC